MHRSPKSTLPMPDRLYWLQLGYKIARFLNSLARGSVGKTLVLMGFLNYAPQESNYLKILRKKPLFWTMAAQIPAHCPVIPPLKPPWNRSPNKSPKNAPSLQICCENKAERPGKRPASCA